MAAIPGDLQAGADRASAEPFHRGPVQQHLQCAPVHGILRPPVTGEQAARLAVHVVAVQADERPFPGLYADGVERRRSNAELLELSDGVGLQIDTHAERPEVGDRLQYHARHPNLVQGESDTESSDAAAGNEDRQVIHEGVLSDPTLPARRGTPGRSASSLTGILPRAHCG